MVALIGRLAVYCPKDPEDRRAAKELVRSGAADDMDWACYNCARAGVDCDFARRHNIV